MSSAAAAGTDGPHPAEGDVLPSGVRSPAGAAAAGGAGRGSRPEPASLGRGLGGGPQEEPERTALVAPRGDREGGETVGRHLAVVRECLAATPPPRILHLQFFIWSVARIQDVEETFEVYYSLRCSYVETDPAANILPPADGERWPQAHHFKWQPQLRMMNMVAECRETEEWWRVTGHSKDSATSSGRKFTYDDLQEMIRLRKEVWVHQFFRTKAVFENAFDLRNFPMDEQHLNLSVTSSWDVRSVLLKFCEFDPPVTFDGKRACRSQLFEMHKPRLLDFDAPDAEERFTAADLDLLSDAQSSRSGTRYCRAHLGLSISRHCSYYMWNVLSIELVIMLAALSIFGISPEDTADRINVLITLVLASTAFKFVTTSMLPATPYVTMLDVFNYVSLGYLAAMLAAVCVISRLHDGGADYDGTFLLVALFAMVLFLVLYAMHSTRLYWRRSKMIAVNDAIWANLQPTVSTRN